MLENIKSIYYLKSLFGCLDEKRKLELIKYNKNIQKNIGIKFINYQFFSRKNIIFQILESF